MSLEPWAEAQKALTFHSRAFEGGSIVVRLAHAGNKSKSKGDSQGQGRFPFFGGDWFWFVYIFWWGGGLVVAMFHLFFWGGGKLSVGFQSLGPGLVARLTAEPKNRNPETLDCWNPPTLEPLDLWNPGTLEP